MNFLAFPEADGVDAATLNKIIRSTLDSGDYPGIYMPPDAQFHTYEQMQAVLRDPRYQNVEHTYKTSSFSSSSGAEEEDYDIDKVLRDLGEKPDEGEGKKAATANNNRKKKKRNKSAKVERPQPEAETVVESEAATETTSKSQQTSSEGASKKKNKRKRNKKAASSEITEENPTEVSEQAKTDEANPSVQDEREVEANLAEKEGTSLKGLTLEDVKSKHLKEKELREALELQDKINEKNKRIEAIDQKNQKRKIEIDKLTVAMKAEEDKKMSLASEVDNLKLTPGFRSGSQIAALSRQLEEISALTLAVKNDLDLGKGDCPICFNGAQQVFSCVDCDNWVCGKCRGLVEMCPSCRLDFKRKPPRRNRAVERLLA